MKTILWIVIFGLLMSAIALVGSVTLFLRPESFRALILPLVAFSAGSLIGGAFFHMIPAAVNKMGNTTEVYTWLAAGFLVFYGLEQFLGWHHSHSHSHSHNKPDLVAGSHPAEFTCAFGDGGVAATTADGMMAPNGAYNCVTHACNGCQAEFGIDGEQHTSRSAITTGVADENEKGNLSQESGPYPDERTGEHQTDVEIAQHQQQDETNSSLEKAAIDLEQARPTVPPTMIPGVPNQQTSSSTSKLPLTYLILIADAVHNFLGGMFVGASFVDSVQVGVSAWLAAAAHEVPQELGDFAVLVHGGWSPSQALLFNFLSSLTFLLGGLVAYATSKAINVDFLLAFAAGNFLYIGGSDLIPEVKHYHGVRVNTTHFLSFTAGMVLLLAIRIAYEGW